MTVARPGGPEWGTRDLCVRYGGRLALDRVSLRVPAGQVVAVVGGDGAGKSTLLSCLAGAIAPSSGSVDRPAKSRLGYLPPGPGVYPDLTVQENLSFRATAYGVKPAGAESRVGQLLERTGLASARGRLAGQLSGGMRRKLGVIAAMIHRPELLVLDEPTTGVDPVSRADLWWLIMMAAAEGAAVVLSTSYLDEAERAASVLVLDDGQPLSAGTPAEIAAQVPGVIRILPGRPSGAERSRAWLRAGQWRLWIPSGTEEAAGTHSAHEAGSTALDRAAPDQVIPDQAVPDEAVPDQTAPDQTVPDQTVPDQTGVVTPDLQDAVTVAMLGREQGGSSGADGLVTTGGGGR